MIKTPTRLLPEGDAAALTLPRDVLDASGLKQGDDLLLTVRDDGVIEIRLAAPTQMLDEAFEWSLDRFPATYRDLAR